MEAMVITASTILSMFTNMTAVDDGGRFAYYADVEAGQVSSITVYDRSSDGRILSERYKDEYVYDAEDRLVEKRTLAWQADSREWRCDRCVTIAYDATGAVVDYRRWDASLGSWGNVQQRMVYTLLAEQVVTVDEFRWDVRLGRLLMADRYLMMHDGNWRHLLAEQREATRTAGN